MASLSLKNVSTVRRGQNDADVHSLSNVSLEIAAREFVVVAGPAGCGKSSLLRTIAGLEEISAGDVCIGDKRINDLAPKDRDVRMVFQNHPLYPHLSIADNLAFGLKVRKFSRTEIKNRVQDAAGILGIESLLDRKPKALSREQRARAAIGRAIVRQAKIFLFDEPLSNLDPADRIRIRTELPRLHQRLQATMIYATRDQAEALAVADRIVVLKEGAVQQIGAPPVLYQEPANLFVASFFGSPPMNFVSGRLKEDGDKMRFAETEGGTIELFFPAADRPAAREFIGNEVVLGIRPQDLEVSNLGRKEGRSAGFAFPAILDAVEPRGDETDLHLQTGAHTLVCRSRQSFGHRDAGRRLQFEMNLARAHLFDPISTKRLA